METGSPKRSWHQHRDVLVRQFCLAEGDEFARRLLTVRPDIALAAEELGPTVQFEGQSLGRAAAIRTQYRLSVLQCARHVGAAAAFAEPSVMFSQEGELNLSADADQLAGARLGQLLGATTRTAVSELLEAHPEFGSPGWETIVAAEGGQHVPDLDAHAIESCQFLLRRFRHVGAAAAEVQLSALKSLVAGKSLPKNVKQDASGALIATLEVIGDFVGPEAELADQVAVLDRQPELLTENALQLCQYLREVDQAERLRTATDAALRVLEAARRHGPWLGPMLVSAGRVVFAPSAEAATALTENHVDLFGPEVPEYWVLFDPARKRTQVTDLQARRFQALVAAGKEREERLTDSLGRYVTAQLWQDVEAQLHDDELLATPYAVRCLEQIVRRRHSKAGMGERAILDGRIILLRRVPEVGIAAAVAEATDRLDDYYAAQLGVQRTLLTDPTGDIRGGGATIADVQDRFALDMQQGLLEALDEFYATGNADVLEVHIPMAEMAVSVSTRGSVLRGALLNSQAGLLRAKAQATGSVADLDRAILSLEEAISCEGSHDWRMRLRANLGDALAQHYDMQEDRPSLERAVLTLVPLVAETAENAGTKSAVMAERLYTLGHIFSQLHHAGDGEALDKAIDALEQAAAIRATVAPGVGSRILTGLAGLLLERFQERNGEQADLARAILLGRESVRLADEPPLKAPALFNFARTLDEQIKRNGSGRTERRRTLTELCQLAARRMPDLYWRAALQLGEMLSDEDDWPAAASALRKASDAIEEVIDSQIVPAHGEPWLATIGSVTSGAAYAAARMGAADQAAVILERGRAVALSQLLERNLADLAVFAAEGHADLVSEYRDLSHRLRAASAGSVARGGPARSLGTLARHRGELAAVIEQLRSLPGHETFLASASEGDIQAAAAHDPLVYLAATERGGLAILVHADGQSYPVWLPMLDQAAVTGHVRRWRDAASLPLHRQFAVLEDTAQWLWDAVMAPVREAAPGESMVVIAGGGLGLLPVHAAWFADSACPTGRRYALDDLRLSFAGNAKTLLAAARMLARTRGTGVVVVDEPYPVSATTLPMSHLEAAAALRGPQPRRHLRRENATRAAVLRSLDHAAIAHFSCHGEADLREPLRSFLLCADDEQLTLRDLMGRDLTGIGMAVLSACETARIGGPALDEVIGFPAGLLQAGIPRVVGSLWTVPEASTAELIIRFYDQLYFQGAEPAEALRQAQRSVRDTTVAEKRLYLGDQPGASDLVPRLLPDDARPYARPYFWAGFSFFGIGAGQDHESVSAPNAAIRSAAHRPSRHPRGSAR